MADTTSNFLLEFLAFHVTKSDQEYQQFFLSDLFQHFQKNSQARFQMLLITLMTCGDKKNYEYNDQIVKKFFFQILIQIRISSIFQKKKKKNIY